MTSFSAKADRKISFNFPQKTIKQTFRGYLEKKFQKLGINHHVVMESSNVELSSLYVEIGLGISFATVEKDMPSLTIRKVEFLSMDHFLSQVIYQWL